MHVQPYLFFNGRCEEALGYYERHLGARIHARMRYGEAPPDSRPTSDANDAHIMYANFTIGESVLMASDDCVNANTLFQGFALSLTVKDKDEAERAFNALADGGQVHAPLGPTFFSPCFGMVVDRFGVSWMVIVPQA